MPSDDAALEPRNASWLLHALVAGLGGLLGAALFPGVIDGGEGAQRGAGLGFGHNSSPIPISRASRCRRALAQPPPRRDEDRRVTAPGTPQ